jgi:hypothetical protein
MDALAVILNTKGAGILQGCVGKANRHLSYFSHSRYKRLNPHLPVPPVIFAK